MSNLGGLRDFDEPVAIAEDLLRRPRLELLNALDGFRDRHSSTSRKA